MDSIGLPTSLQLMMPLPSCTSGIGSPDHISTYGNCATIPRWDGAVPKSPPSGSWPPIYHDDHIKSATIPLPLVVADPKNSRY